MTKKLNAAILLLILVASISGYIFLLRIEDWSPPQMPEQYRITGESGRSMTAILLPDSTAFLIYKSESTTEAIELKLKGTFGKRIIGNIFKVKIPKSMPIKRFEKGATPAAINYTVLDKYYQGNEPPSMQEKGQTLDTIFLFGVDKFSFGSMWMQKEPYDKSFHDSIVSLMKES